MLNIEKYINKFIYNNNRDIYGQGGESVVSEKKIRGRVSYGIFKELAEAGLTEKQMRKVACIIDTQRCWGSIINAEAAYESMEQVLKDRRAGLIRRERE